MGGGYGLRQPQGTWLLEGCPRPRSLKGASRHPQGPQSRRRAPSDPTIQGESPKFPFRDQVPRNAGNGANPRAADQGGTPQAAEATPRPRRLGGPGGRGRPAIRKGARVRSRWGRHPFRAPQGVPPPKGGVFPHRPWAREWKRAPPWQGPAPQRSPGSPEGLQLPAGVQRGVRGDPGAGGGEGAGS